jgi:hypothetical protein
MVSEPFPLAKLAHHVGWVAMLPVDCFVHGAHICGGDLSCQSVEGELYLRPPLERLPTDQRDGLIGREVVPVILKGYEAQGLNRTVG